MNGLFRDLPPVDSFPTVDEIHAFARGLADRYPERVQVREVGHSRNGDPIQLLSIRAKSSRGSVFVIGQPHPNEPIGMATVMAMCERLAGDRAVLDATNADWHFVPCADPDGTRLNEGWFSGPWTREHYARNFYRPAGDTQVEWTFPFSTDGFSVDAPMPETRALMTAIDEVRPVVLASLHNGELGGAYYYVTGGDDALYARLTDLCVAYGIPLHLGDPETPLSVELAPAVFSVPTALQMYEFVTSVGADPAGIVSGGSSGEYAGRHGLVSGLAIELPYWRDDRAADTTPFAPDVTRRQVVLDALDLQEESNSELRALYAAASPLPPSPFAEAVRSFVHDNDGGFLEGQRQQAQTEAEYDRPATVADAFSVMDNVHMFRLRMCGMLLRAVPADAEAYPDVDRCFEQWCAEAAADNRSEAIPIRDLVAVQAEAILATAEHGLSQRAKS